MPTSHEIVNGLYQGKPCPIYLDGVAEAICIGTRVHPYDLPEPFGFNCEMFVSHVIECEVSSREFSPGEFLCKRLNESEDSEDAWARYEAGVRDGAEYCYWFRCYSEATRSPLEPLA